ncbi:endolytic transglycosylase MltG [Streptomyces sp. 549]|uniref:endolytic transglycosylase MltG n=1 Tax=Streptomyces sp. 549 TaxID=3049076 RepID=UPI0024C290F8|nr:endolytic transglycosylase MltG [Streptomyces sp. 549]MDK1473399.1 endolytic transglycosylase MltG [Streptomyces sp. 549]
MSEYGRGHGSQPWHPEDPLYGDRDFQGAQQGDWDGSGTAQPGRSDWSQQNGSGTQDPYGAPGGQSPYGAPAGQDPYAGYAQQQYQYPGQGQYEGQDQPQQYGQHPDPSAGQQQYQGGPAQRYQDPQAPQQPYGNQQQGAPPSYGEQHYGGQDSGQYRQQPYADPTGGPPGVGQPEQPYAAAGDPYGDQLPPDAYGQQPPDYYGTPEAYPPPKPERPQRRPDRDDEQGGAEADTDWDPGPDQGESAFFSDDPEGAAGGGRGDDGGGGRSRRGSAKRKNGFACLVVAAVLLGGGGAVTYYGYGFYQSRFAAAPDFEGQGSGEVQVEIPQGSSVSDMGNILRKAGVVKSHDAFVAAAAGSDSKAQTIQAGSYTLRKEMSASSAIALLLDPKSQSGLIIPEGLRASKIFEMIDERTESPKGTTEKAAESADLGLPPWAEGKVEGFLFPSKYSVTKNSEPEAVLKEMVKRANAEFTKVDMESDAEKVGRTPYEVLTIASLIQAEAQEKDEFGKVSQVIYNRLKPGNSETNGRLDFDSTINYAMGRSTLDVSVDDTRFDSPYNTYVNAGLPPGPIDNPGHQAITAALNPTEGDWLYFVTVKPGDTRFSTTFKEHERHVADFNAEQRKKREESQGSGD